MKSVKLLCVCRGGEGGHKQRAINMLLRQQLLVLLDWTDRWHHRNMIKESETKTKRTHTHTQALAQCAYAQCALIPSALSLSLPLLLTRFDRSWRCGCAASYNGQADATDQVGAGTERWGSSTQHHSQCGGGGGGGTRQHSGALHRWPWGGGREEDTVDTAGGTTSAWGSAPTALLYPRTIDLQTALPTVPRAERGSSYACRRLQGCQLRSQSALLVSIDDWLK